MTVKREENKMARPRGTGSLYHQKGSAVWWVKYYRNGKPYRESTHKTDEKEAQDFLRRRLAEITTGTFAGPRTERIRIEELAEDFLRDYRINGRKSLQDAKARWRLHIQPFFGNLRAVDVSSDLVARYVDSRQQEGAENATINRELACLKRMYHLGQRMTPPKVLRVPIFPKLREDNIRKGFLEDAAYVRLVDASPELWFRALLELGRTYGWRRGELLRMRVREIDLLARTLRLEPGTTKNRDGREVTMTDSIYLLMCGLLTGKKPDDFVFTRKDGTAVRDIRKTWWTACIKAGIGQMVCSKCSRPVIAKNCDACESDNLKYQGLIFHDLRRTAARNLRRAGVAEGVIQKIGGWRTRSVFERYAIVTQSDISDAMKMLQCHQNGHSFGHSEPATENTSTSQTAN
jgi:integrase